MKKKYWIIISIFLLWLTVQLILFYFLRISHGGDTGRFIDAANYIVEEGNIPSGKAAAYTGYNLFIALIFSFGGKEREIVIIQVLLTIMATICLYHLTYKLSKNKLTAFVAIFFYIVSLELQMWNFYILADSLFISMTIISFYLISHFKNIIQLLYTIPIILWASFIRPTGFILLICLAISALVYLWKLHNKKLIILTLSIFLFILFPLLKIIDNMATSMLIVDNYLKGEIIWGYKENVLTVPKDIFINHAHTKNSLEEIFSFMFYNFGYTVKLTVLKLLYFIIHIKPFYSPLHNWLIALFYYPTYILAIFGLYKKHHHKLTKALLLIYLIGQIIVVMLTFEDWDGRFLQYIMPIIFIFSAMGLVDLLTYFSRAIRPLDNKMLSKI